MEYCYKELPPLFENDILEEKFKKMSAGDQTAREEIIEHNLLLVIYSKKIYNFRL